MTIVNNVTCAVVMATYNGIKFIKDQLDSLLHQSYLSYNVYIYDDGSTDGSIDFVKRYIEQNNLKNWSLEVNERNKGWKRNFIDGFSKTKEEIILPCDQDDIWPKHKIGYMVKIFEENPRILVLKGKTIASEKPEGQKDEQISISVSQDLLRRNEMFMGTPGCGIAFRKSFFDEILPYYDECIPHDAFIITMAKLVGGCYKTNFTTVYHRLHCRNTFSMEYQGASYRDKELKRNQVMKAICKILRKYTNATNEIDINSKDVLESLEKFVIFRGNLLLHNNIFNEIKSMLYIRNYGNLRRWLAELWKIRNR